MRAAPAVSLSAAERSVGGGGGGGGGRKEAKPELEASFCVKLLSQQQTKTGKRERRGKSPEQPALVRSQWGHSSAAVKVEKPVQPPLSPVHFSSCSSSLLPLALSLAPPLNDLGRSVISTSWPRLEAEPRAKFARLARWLVGPGQTPEGHHHFCLTAYLLYFFIIFFSL